MSEITHEWSWGVKQEWRSRLDNRNGYTKGIVITPFGYVDVYAQGDENHFHHTELRFIHCQREYVRSYKKRYSHRYIVTLSRKFIKDILGV
jgi:hypothetical protein